MNVISTEPENIVLTAQCLQHPTLHPVTILPLCFYVFMFFDSVFFELASLPIGFRTYSGYHENLSAEGSKLHDQLDESMEISNPVTLVLVIHTHYVSTTYLDRGL